MSLQTTYTKAVVGFRNYPQALKDTAGKLPLDKIRLAQKAIRKIKENLLDVEEVVKTHIDSLKEFQESQAEVEDKTALKEKDKETLKLITDLYNAPLSVEIDDECKGALKEVFDCLDITKLEVKDANGNSQAPNTNDLLAVDDFAEDLHN